MYFRKTIQTEQNSFTMNADMIRLLASIDETKDLRQIKRELGMDSATLKDALTRLLKNKLIEPVVKGVRYLEESFNDILVRNLTLAVGPMGEFILEDALADMDMESKRIPLNRAAELIHYVASQIPEEPDRIRFVESMIKIIPK
jgi:hypothetical protein